MTDEQFVKFCILCGCDYCTNVPKVGNTTALKIKKHNNIEDIIEEYKNKYEFPEGYTTHLDYLIFSFLLFI